MESQNQNIYSIKTEFFEGPFNLLLNLIEKRKLFINDLSLALVTEDYLNYLSKIGGLPDQEGFSPREVSSFLVVASTLLLIKSKSLLPNLDLTKEEEGDIKNLEDRLRLYEIFTRLGNNIKNNFGKEIIFAPLERKNTNIVFLPDDQITKESMMTFAQNVLNAIPKKVFLPKVEVKVVVSIEEMIDKLTERIKTNLTMNFRDFHGLSTQKGKIVNKEEKIVVIVGFLAMLELVRQGIINAVQEHDSEDIFIEKQEQELQTELQEIENSN